MRIEVHRTMDVQCNFRMTLSLRLSNATDEFLHNAHNWTEEDERTPKHT